MKRKQLLLGLLALLIVGASVGYYFFQKKTPDASAYRTDAKLSAMELFTAFELNENTANQQFLGKTLEVQGEIKSIDNKADSPTATVYLDGGGLLGGIACEMAKDKLSDDLAPGQSILIKGICSGLLMDVVLNRCVIVN